MISRGIFSIAAGIALASGAQAAEWSFEPSITAKTRYDDNLRMSTTDEVKATELSLKPSADFSRKTERTDITGTVNFAFRRFDEDGLDTNDSEFGLDVSHLFSEKTRVGLSANWDDDTTLDSELDQTGIVFDRVERTSKNLSPSITHAINERLSAQANLSLTQVEYDTRTSLYNDYDYDSASGQLNWQYSPQTQLFGVVGLTRYETSNGNLQTDNQQLTLGFEHQFTERMTVNAYAGRRRTETEIQSQTQVCPTGSVPDFLALFLSGGATPCLDTTTLQPVALILQPVTSNTNNSGTVYSLSLTRELERGELKADLSRSLTPSATEGVIDTTRVTLGWKHRFTQMLSSNLRLTWYDSQNTADSVSSVDRNYIEFSPNLSWRLDRDLSFSANYRYRKQDREGTLGSATSNAVSFALNYSWPKVAVSR